MSRNLGRKMVFLCSFPTKPINQKSRGFPHGNFPDLLAKFSRVSRSLIHTARRSRLAFLFPAVFNRLSQSINAPSECQDTAKAGRGNRNTVALILHKCSVIAVLSFYLKSKGETRAEGKLSRGERAGEEEENCRCLAGSGHTRARPGAAMPQPPLLQPLLPLIIIPLLIKYLIYK